MVIHYYNKRQYASLIILHDKVTNSPRESSACRALVIIIITVQR